MHRKRRRNKGSESYWTIFVILENCPVVMDKSFIFRKPTSYNLSGTVKVMLLKTLFTPFLARAKRNVEVLL